MKLRRLDATDEALLQSLLVRCSDYYELAEGGPTRPIAAAEELASTPKDRSVDDKFAFGIFEGEELVGYLDLFRDYPTPAEWWVGFLVLAPEHRARGLGKSVMAETMTWLRAQGASNVWLCVLEQNPAAQRFWRSLGFEERERQDFVAPTGYRSRVLLMSRSVGADSPFAESRPSP